MYLNEKKINKLFFYWLASSLVLVFSIVIVGGLTRLTNSGLSITEWELFKGILPPMSKNSWNIYFEQYKQIPQYKLLNSGMTLEEFKIIFYWEYYHRVLARIIGLFFLIPLVYFYFTKKINEKYLKMCLIIFILIIFQGIVGWFMVKSGLINETTVSHYRLSTHLIIAFLIICSIYWLLKNIKSNKFKYFFKFSYNNFLFQLLIFLIFIQIIFGAFVSGLDAGKIYQTWPKMNETYFPNDFLYNNFYSFFDFDNHSLVQFYHRSLAYLIIFYAAFMSVYIYKKKLLHLYKSLLVFLIILFSQVLLGIITLVSGLNIYLASTHQITSVLLVLSALNLYYLRSK